MTRRAYISPTTKLAALICEVLEIPHEHQLLMHEKHVLALVQWDHYPVPKALDGSDRFSNLRMLLIGTHRDVTAKRDIPTIAKVKRLARVTAEASRRLLAKHQGEPAPETRRSRLQSRGFQKDTRPKGQRGFQRRRSR